ncbi:MAG: nitroreductase family deazaflavin-dependent oxidoreductase [Nocardioidaceae bacterium]|nr:nitroreductase family deazaflavin-dependent oxidoreductase [Nocardioidaceae bacterium]
MESKKRPDGLDSPIVPTMMKHAGRLHVRVYRATNGRIGGKWRIGAGWKKPVPTLLLDHVGRKSGTRFTTPLLFLDDAPDVVVVASQGGLPKNPQWYANLLAHPETQVQIRGEKRAVRARTATADERAALWPRLVDLYADFASYQAWTDREIPVVILERR